LFLPRVFLSEVEEIINKGELPMFRKILCGGIAMLGLLAPLSYTSSAQARDVVYVYPHHHPRYEVIYRPSPFQPWRVYAVFHSPRAAHDAAIALRFQGFQTRVIHPY
jgi:hypothetical protein